LNRKAIKQYAHEQGYDDIRKSGRKYKDFDVYKPMCDDNFITGLPLAILVQGENIRMTTAEEALEIGY